MASDTIKTPFGSVSKDGMQGGASDVRAVASQIANDAGESVGKVSEAVGDLYVESTYRARDAMDELPARLSDVGAAGERLVRRGRRRLNHGVRRQPVEALLLAGAIGYLAGWAVNRA